MKETMQQHLHAAERKTIQKHDPPRIQWLAAPKR